MSIEDVLSLLSAGLDRDEQLARAAAESSGTDDGAWYAGETDHHGIGLFASEEEGRRIDYWPTAETEHITEQSPRRVLLQVESIRAVIEDYQRRLPSSDDPALDDPEFRASWMGYRIAGELFLRALASIYTEDTTETEKP
ncbi:DUF6221 family protein [Nocardia abscessus]|uniref:DUF6221 family protein n=1 Tax=Nocardia abscessus TaxID=120957 RepID=UPI0024584DDD|nr:DUF6221 family protein [Nocardia abscessus]